MEKEGKEAVRPDVKSPSLHQLSTLRLPPPPLRLSPGEAHRDVPVQERGESPAGLGLRRSPRQEGTHLHGRGKDDSQVGALLFVHVHQVRDGKVLHDDDDDKVTTLLTLTTLM